MRRFMVLLASLFSATSVVGGELVEFSTSLGFDELAVLVKHLRAKDAELADEISRNIKSFRSDSSLGDSKDFSLKTAKGHMTLEREDDSTVAIYVFTSLEAQRKIDAASDEADEELGI